MPARPHPGDHEAGAVRSKRRWMVLAGCLALALLPACRWTSGEQYFVHWGPRTDIVIHQRASFDLTVAGNLFFENNQSFAAAMGNFRCNGNRSRRTANACVMALLRTRAQIGGAAQGFWVRATSSSSPQRFDDFDGAFTGVRNSASPSSKVAMCLTLSAYPHKVNWTTRARSDSNCRTGRHVWE